MTTVYDAPCRGFLPARVMRGAAVGDPECVFVGVHLVEVEASWVLDVSVDVEHQASRLITQRRGIDRYGVDELVDFVRVDVECDEQGVHNLCLNQWVDSAAGCEPIEFIDRLCRESDHAGSRCDSGRHATVVLDIANTGVARGKVYAARERGERLPDGWAIDASGLPTNEPQAALDGLILPMSGHKGYAISFMMDVLSGVLTASACGADVVGPYVPDKRSGCGHLVIAINIAAIMPLERFTQRIDKLITTIKSSRAFDMADLPGLKRRQLCRETAVNYVVKPDTAGGTVRPTTALATAAQCWLLDIAHPVAPGESGTVRLDRFVFGPVTSSSRPMDAAAAALMAEWLRTSSRSGAPGPR